MGGKYGGKVWGEVRAEWVCVVLSSGAVWAAGGEPEGEAAVGLPPLPLPEPL